MPISRPLLIALIGVVAIGAAVLLTRGGGGDAASTASVTPPPPETLQAAEAPPAQRGAQEPPRTKREGSAGETEAGFPRQVEQALARDRVTVVFLYQPGAADDAATLRQIRELEEARDRSSKLQRRTAVFSAPLSDAARYLGVTGAIGVTRAPAIAIMRPNREVRLLEGYTDGRSLRQHLTDAL